MKLTILCECGKKNVIISKQTEIIGCSSCNKIIKIPKNLLCPQCKRKKSTKWFVNGVCKRCNDINKGYYERHKKLNIACRFKLSLVQYNEITTKCFLCNWKHNIIPHHILPKSKGGKDDYSNYIGLCPNHHARVHSDLEYLKRVIKRICKYKNISIPSIFHKKDVCKKKPGGYILRPILYP